MLRSDTLARYYDAVWCIAASPFVSQYMVGYTRRPSRLRLSEYWQMHGYQYLVVLADGLSLEDAHKLEKYLQEEIWASKKSSVLYQKYNPDRREGRHYPSAGPTASISETSKHAVYMAWWDKHSD